MSSIPWNTLSASPHRWVGGPALDTLWNTHAPVGPEADLERFGGGLIDPYDA
ncbi:hypothetical protein [uncultured Amnibacterium sp.]|uniref:hypothetical protein n=1 Tax=uncultured Amnibacterium sp. TaxID=1631851 RepID=UPI0035C9E830